MLRFNVGDRVRIVAAKAHPLAVGRVYTVTHVGPWTAGDTHPCGTVCIKDNDYLIDMDGEPLACRESNLEPA